MTTNESIDDIKTELERSANRDVNIKISYQIDTTADFLDVNIKNKDSHLRTTIYHKPAAEPYILPYQSEHPRHTHRNIPYSALLRAARICSNLYDFNRERVRIDMSLLLNGYPPTFITTQFNRLLHSNHYISLSKPMDEHVYHQMHTTLAHQPTRREKQLDQMMKNPVESPSVLQQKVWNQKVMYPHYSFDGAKSTELRKWWDEHYAYGGSPVLDVKVRLVADTY
jgi:hypothetical protein